MPFEADKKYPVVVVDAEAILSNKKGTPGLSVKFRADSGDEIWHTFWMVETTKDRFIETFKDAFELDPALLRHREFWGDPLAMLAGKRVEISTKEDDYNGRSRVIVNYVNPLKAKKLAAADAFLAIFGSDEDQQAELPLTPFS